MKVTCEINDYSNPAQPNIKIHSAWATGSNVEIEVDGERYEVNGKELISAVQKAMLDIFGR